jgi:hypothetical protein
MRCPHPDWLDNRLTITGPAADLAAFRAAAAGAGIVPWAIDVDAFEEDLFHRLLTPPPEQRGISLYGARILTRSIRDLAWQDHEDALAQLGVSRACPFDLHSLAPAPWRILKLGPDHPDAIAWQFAHWGTTWPLRRVELLSEVPRVGVLGLRIGFWSADWSPWPVITTCRQRWPSLRFKLAVEYWWDTATAALPLRPAARPMPPDAMPPDAIAARWQPHPKPAIAPPTLP